MLKYLCAEVLIISVCVYDVMLLDDMPIFKTACSVCFSNFVLVIMFCHHDVMLLFITL